jgi:Concanavalin A-like lectin/glucanases superfamily
MQLTPSRRAVLKLLSVAPQARMLSTFAAQSPLQDAIANTTDYHGALLSPALPNEAKDWLPGRVATLLLRFRTPSAEVTGELAALRDSARNACFVLSLEQVEGAAQLQFSLRTDHSTVPLQLAMPVALMGAARWHSVIARYAGPRAELFVDGVLVDEEWPMGVLRPQGVPVFEIGSSTYSGEISQAALWKRSLSDAEVASLSGEPGEIAARRKAYLGEPSSQLQYWKPPGWNTSAGDAMPMFRRATVSCLLPLRSPPPQE